MQRTSPGVALLVFVVGGLMITHAIGQDGTTSTNRAAGQAARAAALRGALDEVAPPVTDDRLKKLGERIDQLTKDLAAAKDLGKRLDAAEKSLKDLAGLKAKMDAAEKQLKAQADMLKVLDKLKDVPDRMDKLDKVIKGISDNVKSLESKVKAVEDESKKIGDLTKKLAAAEARVVKLEKAHADADKMMKDLASKIQVLSDKVEKAADNKIKDLEAKLAKEKEAREKAVKELKDELKKQSGGDVLPGMPLLPGCFPCPTYEMPCPWSCPPACPSYCPPACPLPHSGFAPAMAQGCFGECFPVITPWPNCFPYAEQAPLMPPAKVNGQEKKKNTLKMPEEFSTSLRQQASPVSLRQLQPSTVKIDRIGLTSADADRLFWQGYRHYWQKETEKARALFTVATELSAEDARYWYFKSLSEQDTGMTAEASRSLKRAVELHLEGKPRADVIGRSLERVQGEQRMKMRQVLEARRSAR